MAPILADMERDLFRPTQLREGRRGDGIRISAAARLPQRGDVIDVHSEAQCEPPASGRGAYRTRDLRRGRGTRAEAPAAARSPTAIVGRRSTSVATWASIPDIRAASSGAWRSWDSSAARPPRTTSAGASSPSRRGGARRSRTSTLAHRGKSRASSSRSPDLIARASPTPSARRRNYSAGRRRRSSPPRIRGRLRAGSLYARPLREVKCGSSADRLLQLGGDRVREPFDALLVGAFREDPLFWLGPAVAHEDATGLAEFLLHLAHGPHHGRQRPQL